MEKRQIIYLILLIFVMLNSKNHVFVIGFFGFIFFIELLHYLIAKNPNSDLINFLFKPRGPRTDTKSMNRNELFGSAIRFLAASLIFFISLFIAGSLPRKIFDLYVVQGLFFFITFGFLISFGAGLYLFVRGIFKKK